MRCIVVSWLSFPSRLCDPSDPAADQQHDNGDEIDDDLIDTGQHLFTSFIEAKDCRMPSRKPAATAPPKLPMPPTTTTTKESTRKSMPI